MGYCDRLSHNDTLGEFEIARVERMTEGMILASHEHRLAAAYLVGYVVEMTLKSAYHRLWGFHLNEPINMKTLRTTRELARLDLGVDIDPEGFHNPVFWARVIINMRDQLDYPLEQAVSVELVARTQRIRTNWRVWMRYRSDRFASGELRDLIDDAMWINQQYDVLASRQ